MLCVAPTMLPAGLPVSCLLDSRMEMDGCQVLRPPYNAMPAFWEVSYNGVYDTWWGPDSNSGLASGFSGRAHLPTIFMISDFPCRGPFYRELLDNFTREINES